MKRVVAALATTVALTPGAHAQSPSECTPPATVIGDSSAGLNVTYRARFDAGTIGANQAFVPREPATVVPPHELRLDLGYDARDRLVARAAVVSEMPDGESLALGTFRNVRASHTIGNQLVVAGNGCEYLGGSPDQRERANPIGSLATSGSLGMGLLAPSLAALRSQGAATEIGTDRVRVASRLEASPATGNVAADIVREYRLLGSNWTLASAEITTSTTARVGGRLEYFRHTSTHDFSVLSQAVHAANEARRAVAPLNIDAPAGTPPRRFDLQSLAQSLVPALPVVRLGPGSGQNVVLQHGIFSSAGTWSRMDGWLAPRYQLGNTLIPSLPSTEPLDTQRDQLIRLIELSGARNNILIGHSNGGLISRALAQSRPDLVRGVITNSTLHNGAILAKSLRTEAARGIQALAAHLGAGCSTPADSIGCYLADVVQNPLVNLAIANFAFDTAIPATRDMQPESAFIRRINATGEPFPRVSIENKSDARWVAFRLIGDALCNPEAGCGGRAWVNYVNAAYIALRTCAPIALLLGSSDPANAAHHASTAAHCSHLAGALDAIDRYWNDLYSAGEGGDGIVNIGAQRWNGALAVRVANADSHQGVNKSDKVRDKLFAVLDQQFQVPRRINPAAAATAVSGASYSAEAVAADSIISIFGAALAETTAQAGTVPVPTSLGGTTVEVRDARGVTRAAGLFFVSPNQINAALPAGVANGTATFTVRTAAGVVRSGAFQVAPVAPGIFTANANGTGVPAGYVIRVRGGVQTSEPLAEADPAGARQVARPIDPGADTDQLHLVLFGTGLRSRSDLSKVLVQIGGVAHPVAYAGAQGMLGLDQINIPLARELAGRGEVDVRISVDGIAANTTRIAIR